MLRFAVRAVLIAILHFAITLAFVFAWSGASEAENQRTWTSFGYSAGTMAFSSPLYQVPAARQRLPFLAGTAINSALWGIFLAIVFSRVRRLWLLLLIPILWYATFTSVAALLERRVPIATRFPHQNANESSRRVDQLLKAIDDEDFSRMRGGLQKYLSAEFARGDDRIEPLPVDAEHFIVQHRFDLDSLEIALLSSEPPRWEIDLTASEKSDWLRYFWLQKLIVADAVDSAHSMNVAGSRQRLEAARRLTFSLASRPEAVAVMTAIASTENQLGAARKLGTTLPRFDPRDDLIDALEAESWNDRFLVATSRFDRDWNNRSVFTRALLTIFVRPYARLCAAISSVDQLRNVRMIRDFGRCVFQPPKYPEEHQPGIINPIAARSVSATAVRAVRSNRLLLDFEGTEKIAQAKTEGTITAACSCPDHKWMFDGGVVYLEPPVPVAHAALPPQRTINPAARTPSAETSPATATNPPSPR
jgi:hypothetical protein